MNLTVETERESDGRWIAEVPDLSGALAYGAARDRAIAGAEALALRVIAERLENDGMDRLSTPQMPVHPRFRNYTKSTFNPPSILLFPYPLIAP